MQRLTREALERAITLIDHRRWTNGSWKTAVLFHVAHNTIDNPDAPEGWPVPLSGQDFEDTAGIHRWRAWRTVRELLAEHIIVKEAGAGSRANAYEIEANVERWDVSWRLPRGVALAQVAATMVDPAPHETQFVARWGRAKSTRHRAASPRDKTGGVPRLSRGWPARQTDPAGALPARARRATNGASRAAQEIVSARAGRAESSAADARPSVSLEIEPLSLTQRGSERVLAAVFEASGNHVHGRFAIRVEAAVAKLDRVDELVAAIARAPRSPIVESYVRLVEQWPRGSVAGEDSQGRWGAPTPPVVTNQIPAAIPTPEELEISRRRLAEIRAGARPTCQNESEPTDGGEP